MSLGVARETTYANAGFTRPNLFSDVKHRKVCAGGDSPELALPENFTSTPSEDPSHMGDTTSISHERR